MSDKAAVGKTFKEPDSEATACFLNRHLASRSANEGACHSWEALVTYYMGNVNADVILNMMMSCYSGLGTFINYLHSVVPIYKLDI